MGKSVGEKPDIPAYDDIVDALKDTHKLYIEALKGCYESHDITRIMGNEYLLKRIADFKK